MTCTHCKRSLGYKLYPSPFGDRCLPCWPLGWKGYRALKRPSTPETRKKARPRYR